MKTKIFILLLSIVFFVCSCNSIKDINSEKQNESIITETDNIFVVLQVIQPFKQQLMLQVIGIL